MSFETLFETWESDWKKKTLSYLYSLVWNESVTGYQHNLQKFGRVTIILKKTNGGDSGVYHGTGNSFCSEHAQLLATSSSMQMWKSGLFYITKYHRFVELKRGINRCIVGYIFPLCNPTMHQICDVLVSGINLFTKTVYRLQPGRCQRSKASGK